MVQHDDILEVWYDESGNALKKYVDNIGSEFERLAKIWDSMQKLASAPLPTPSKTTPSIGSNTSSSSIVSGGNTSATDQKPSSVSDTQKPSSVTFDIWGHQYEVSNGGHVITKNGSYVPAQNFQYLPQEVVEAAREMKHWWHYWNIDKI